MRIQVGGTSKLRKDNGIWYINANRDGANEFINGIFNLSGFIPKQWNKKGSNDKTGKKRANAWINEMGLTDLANNIAKKRININSNNNNDIHGNLHRGSINLGKDTEIANVLNELYVIASNNSKTLEDYIFKSSISATSTEFNSLPSRIKSKKNAKTDESIQEEREKALNYLDDLVVNSRRLVNQKHKRQHPTSTPQSVAHENRATQSKTNSDDKKKKRALSRKIKKETIKQKKKQASAKANSENRVKSQVFWGKKADETTIAAMNSKSSKKGTIRCSECESEKSPSKFTEKQISKKPTKRKCMSCTSSMNMKKVGRRSRKQKTRQTKKAKKKSKKKTRKNN
jgi:hypothetical protein